MRVQLLGNVSNPNGFFLVWSVLEAENDNFEVSMQGRPNNEEFSNGFLWKRDQRWSLKIITFPIVFRSVRKVSGGRADVPCASGALRDPLSVNVYCERRALASERGGGRRTRRVASNVTISAGNPPREKIWSCLQYNSTDGRLKRIPLAKRK